MLCPHCRTELPDGTAICTVCDAILDSTFLNASTEPGVDGDGAPVIAPRAPAPPPSALPVVPSAADLDPMSSPRLGDDLSGSTDGTAMLQMDPERHKETRIVNVSDLPSRRGPQAPKPGAPRAAAGAEQETLDDFWGQVFLAYRRLRPLEKGAMYCLLALFVAAFLPWFHVRGEGFVSGIEGKGALTAVGGFLALVVFWIRVNLRVVLLVLLQVACVVFGGLMAGWSLRTAAASHVPSFGIYVTLLCGIAAAVMSLVAAVKS